MELVSRSVRPSQPQPIEPQDALELGKQHLDFLPLPARDDVLGAAGDVPVLDWRAGIYNPHVDVTRETTTLYASDRDIFVFLVDDRNPIEAGRLPDGSPDLFFRGFYAWNSEVGVAARNDDGADAQ